uniref:Uncharacterized protein n=1 Tax=Solanum tuberosum TaxID=4113 RepID=M1BB19_SOLTU
MVANKSQTTQHKHKKGTMFEDKIVLPKDLVDMSQEPNNSPTESQDIVQAVNKIRKAIDGKNIKAHESKSKGVTKRK